MTTTCDPIGSTDLHRLAELEIFADGDADLLAVVADRGVAVEVAKGRELVNAQIAERAQPGSGAPSPELGSARSVEPASRHAVTDTEGSTASA